MINGQALDHPDGLLIALNKPVGYTCSHDEAEGALVYDLVPQQWRRRKPAITTIGRWAGFA
jgi:16S rRNA pseudouridine516 synthase